MTAPGPIRTCIGCRRRDRPAVLLRIVVGAGTEGPIRVLIPDPGRRLPGRGAWLHPSIGCFDAAERRRAFGRSLRTGGAPDTSAVRQFVLRNGATAAAPEVAPQDAGSRRRRRKQVDPT